MSENYLIHIGNKNSGRYPRGSGMNPNQHSQYGKVGKMSRKQIKKAAKTYYDERNKVFSDAANHNSREKYGTDDTRVLTDKQIADSINIGEAATQKYLLDKYGSKNLSKIITKADKQNSTKALLASLGLLGGSVLALGGLEYFLEKKTK